MTCCSNSFSSNRFGLAHQRHIVFAPWLLMQLTVVIVCLLIGKSSCSAFTVSTPTKNSAIKMGLGINLGGLFKNPLDSSETSSSSAASSTSTPVFFAPNTPFDPSPEGLITRAKILLASDFGLLDAGTMLDDQFIWIGATSNGNVLSKEEYLAAGRFFQLRNAFPDLDYRSHDYRVDTVDPMTVRLTARAVGNMRGPLRLRTEVVAPNGRQMVCPPEAISITFNKSTGKVKKICSGFTMDRLVGNTGGLCGIMAAATVAGSPPSDFEVYPATTVIARFFGRPVRQLDEPKSYLAPFPESVMVQLAKGIVSAEMASLDPDLLSNTFTFCGPYIGPINKLQFLETYAAGMFGGAEPDLSHFRVDPYDPYRVWVDAKSMGEFEDGDVFETPPTAMSFTFDDNGFCTRITGDAVMDPSIGNSGGLAGIEGINYAAGAPSPEITTRPLPQVLGRTQKRLLERFTNIGVDDYVLESMVAPPAVDMEIETTPSPVQKLTTKTSTPKPPLPPMTTKSTTVVDDKKKALAAAAAEKAKMAAEKAKMAAEKTAAAAAAKKEAVRKAQLEKAAKIKSQAKAKAAAAAAELKLKKEKEAAAKKKQAATKSKATTGGATPFRFPSIPPVVNQQRSPQASNIVNQANKLKDAAAAAKQAQLLAAAEKKRLADETARADRAVRSAQAERKKRQAEEKAKAVQAKNDAAEQKRQMQAEQKRKQAEQKADAIRIKKEAEEKKRQAQEEKKRIAAAQEQKMAAERKRIEMEQAKKAAIEKKAKEVAAAKQQAKAAAAAAASKKAKATPPKKPPSSELFGRAMNMQLSRTIALPKRAEDLKPNNNAKGKVGSAASSSAAPRGVPVLNRWRRNVDNSVTGFIFGSDAFEENERVTTSPIAKGQIVGGTVVQTQSGSRYFLS